jgi:hypothetical protein
MKTILTDKFELGNFGKYPIKLIVDRLGKDEVCFDIEFKQEEEEDELVNTITDTELLTEISDLCGFVLKKGKNVKVELKGDERVYVVKKENGKIIFYELLTDGGVGATPPVGVPQKLFFFFFFRLGGGGVPPTRGTPYWGIPH